MLDHAIGGYAALPAEEMMEHQRGGGHQFADAQGNHGKGGRTLLGGHGAEKNRQPQAAEAGKQRHYLHRDRQAAIAGGGDQMDHRVAADAKKRCMT